MEGLCYSALDLAAVISSMNLECRETAAFLERVWEGERPFLREKYREDKRRLLLDTLYWLTYLGDKPTIDAEFPMIQRDVRALGGELSKEDYLDNCADLDLFFKSARLRILYTGGKGYIRIKRRTLLSRYGYKRLSPNLIEHFHRCISFYRLRSYRRGMSECRIEDTGIDEMIVFRVVKSEE